MAAMEPQSCFRVLPSEPMHDPPLHGTPAGQVNMPPRNALPIRYFYLLFSMEPIKEFVKQTNKQVSNITSLNILLYCSAQLYITYSCPQTHTLCTQRMYILDLGLGLWCLTRLSTIFHLYRGQLQYLCNQCLHVHGSPLPT